MPAEPDVHPAGSGERRTRHPDRTVAALAGRQHGVVGRAQLASAGLSRHAIDDRILVGRLHPVHRGVYAVGHRSLSPRGRWMAAVLAGGPGAVLSHRAAAALWELGPAQAPEVTCPSQRRPRKGVVVHTGALRRDEVTVRDGIPVTTVARTLLDLAAVVPPRQLERAAREAEVLRLADVVPLLALAERHPGRRGVAVVRALLTDGRVGAGVTRSELEERFLAFIDAAGLHRPALNARVAAGGRSLECDCVWRAQRLVVELDGHAFHTTRAAYERDRARDRTLHVAGWRVVRVTWRQLHGEGAGLAADLRTLLAHRG